MNTLTKTLLVVFVVCQIFFLPCVSIAQSDWEFYFFGVNVTNIKGGDISGMVVGATTSLFVHELGHVLYLKSQGKGWKVTTSKAGIGVWSEDYFTNNQHKKLGRAGFALQALTGAILLTADSTKETNFTKGWIGMNMLQLTTADLRGNNDLNRIGNRE